MSSINGISGNSPLQQTQTVTTKTTTATTTARQSLTDRLELSNASQFIAALKTNDVRTDKVAAIKAQIASGIYDADGSKLDAATDKLLDAIGE